MHAHASPSTVIARFNSVKTICRRAVRAPAYRRPTSSCNLVISNGRAIEDFAHARRNKSALSDSGRIFFSTNPNYPLSDRTFFFYDSKRKEECARYARVSIRENIALSRACVVKIRHRRDYISKFRKSSVFLSFFLPFLLPSLFFNHMRRTDESTNIRDMHLFRSRRSGRTDKYCNSRFPAHRVAKRRFSRLTLCNDVCKMLSDCARNSVAQCIFRYDDFSNVR